MMLSTEVLYECEGLSFADEVEASDKKEDSDTDFESIPLASVSGVMKKAYNTANFHRDSMKPKGASGQGRAGT